MLKLHLVNSSNFTENFITRIPPVAKLLFIVSGSNHLSNDCLHKIRNWVTRRQREETGNAVWRKGKLHPIYYDLLRRWKSAPAGFAIKRFFTLTKGRHRIAFETIWPFSALFYLLSSWGRKLEYSESCGLVVMRRVLGLRSREFKSQHWWQCDFFTFICCKIVLLLLFWKHLLIPHKWIKNRSTRMCHLKIE